MRIAKTRLTVVQSVIGETFQGDRFQVAFLTGMRGHRGYCLYSAVYDTYQAAYARLQQKIKDNPESYVEGKV